MLRADSRRPVLALLAVVTLAYVPSPCEARPGVPTAGSSIAPTFSIRPDAVKPDAEVTLLLCVTNENPSASRELARGDVFRFAFGDGLVVDCGDVSAFSPSGGFGPADFTCTAEPDSVTFTYVGAPIAWPLGDMVCAPTTYVTGAGPSTVMTSLRVANRGAWSPARPAAIPLTPSSELADARRSTCGNAVMAVSTGSVAPRAGTPPEVIPGLDTPIAVRQDSKIFVALHAPIADSANCPLIDRMVPGRYVIELDGSTAAVGDWFSLTLAGFEDINAVWLSGELDAGEHRVRVILDVQSDDARYSTPCFGSSANDENQARLIVIEIPR